jgi:protein disulfide-isomerase A6
MFAGIYAEVASILKGSIKIAKIDGMENWPITEHYDVKNFPTFKIFPPGDKELVTPEDFTPEVDLEGLVAAIQDRFNYFTVDMTIPKITD